VTVIHRNRSVQPDQPGPDGLVRCAQLTHTPAIGKCPRGATVVAIDSTFGNGFGRKATIDQVVWPAAPITPEALAALPVHALVVGTNGSTAAVESVRTQLENAVPSRFPPDSPDSDRLLAGYKQLANVVILVSLPIAGCSLAVAVAAGLADRRRPFSVLRLTGAPLAMLRRVVALETVVPLVLTAAASIAIGFLAAALFLRAQLDQTLVAPGPQYYLIVALGLVAALAILGSTLPMLSRITGPEASPFD
jgi:predicted lysophospholipase L1 biosynthesis ABC-type transport system permease subunit